MLALRKGVRPRAVAWTRVKAGFAGSRALTKQQIALILAARYPELAPRLPPLRKPWMGEDPRLSIFKALVFALALFPRQSGPRIRRPRAA